jgi:hypothetical protein
VLLFIAVADSQMHSFALKKLGTNDRIVNGMITVMEAVGLISQKFLG